MILDDFEYVFSSRRKDLSALLEDFWWVLDILRCSVWAGENSCWTRVCAVGWTSWLDIAGRTCEITSVSCLPSSKKTLHLSEFSLPKIWLSWFNSWFRWTKFQLFWWRFRRVGLVVTQSQFALVWDCRTFLLLWAEWVHLAGMEGLWSCAILVLKKTLHYTSQVYFCVLIPWSKFSHLWSNAEV